MSRIGVRVLIGQYLELGNTIGVDAQVGLINERCVPRQVASDAAEDASFMCERAYGFAPDVVFLGSNLDRHFPYVDSHLYYVMFELVKNSLRATVEHNMKKHGKDFDELNDAHLPPVKIIIADGAVALLRLMDLPPKMVDVSLTLMGLLSWMFH